MSHPLEQEEQDNSFQTQSADAEKVLRMGTAPIGMLMLEFAIPAVVSVVFNALYNVIDSVFLGQAMGEVGLAATTVAAPIMTVSMALSTLPGMGGNALAAILLGEGRHEDAERVLGNTVTIMVIIAAIVAIIATFWIDPLLIIVGATDVTLPYARLFVRIILYGCLITNISFGVNNFIRTAGAPNLALWTTVIGTAVCIVLNYVFVMLFGWGVAGSASATIIGQGVTAAIILWYFIAKRSHAPFKLRAKNLALDAALSRRLLALGLAPFALQAAMAVTQVVGNMVLAAVGAGDPIGVDGTMASIGVVFKITGLITFPGIGIAMAAQPMLGFNTGARKYRRVLKTLYVALGSATAILFILFAIIHIFPAQLVGLFGVEDDLMDFGIWALQVQTALIPFIAIQMIGSNYFQATGQPVKATILSLTRQLIFVIPLYLACPVVMPMLFCELTPLMGYSFTFPIADTLSIVLCGAFLIAEIRKLHRKIDETEIDTETSETSGECD